MNKAYLGLVAFLIIVTIGIGSFAIYRTVQGRNRANYFSQPSLTLPKNPKAENPTVQTTPAVVDEKPVSNNLKLTLTSPKDGQVFTLPKVTISGVTGANCDISINDLELKAGPTGKFQTTITLDEGENPLYIFASDQEGNFAEWQGTVSYTPAE